MDRSGVRSGVKSALIGFSICVMIGVFAAASEARANFEQSKRWFISQSHPARADLQENLYWSGDYDGAVDGLFGSQTYAALVTFQSRVGVSPDGVLDVSQIAELRSQARRVRLLVQRHLESRGESMTGNTYAIRSPYNPWLVILP